MAVLTMLVILANSKRPIEIDSGVLTFKFYKLELEQYSRL